MLDPQNQKDPSTTPPNSRSELSLLERLFQEALERARPEIEEARRAAKKKKRVTVKKAYAHYRAHCENPYKISWFREKVANGELFDSICVEDFRPNNPSGITYLVTLESIDKYLEKNPVGAPLPKYVPIETAFYKLQDKLPAELSLLKFKCLVKEGALKTVTEAGVEKIETKTVLEHFKARSQSKASRRTTMPSPKPRKAASHNRVSVSTGDYSGPQQLQEAVKVLTSQGLEVEVLP